MGVIPQPPRPENPTPPSQRVQVDRARLVTTCAFCDLSQFYGSGKCIECGAALSAGDEREGEPR